MRAAASEPLCLLPQLRHGHSGLGVLGQTSWAQSSTWGQAQVKCCGSEGEGVWGGMRVSRGKAGVGSNLFQLCSKESRWRGYWQMGDVVSPGCF